MRATLLPPDYTQGQSDREDRRKGGDSLLLIGKCGSEVKTVYFRSGGDCNQTEILCAPPIKRLWKLRSRKNGNTSRQRKRREKKRPTSIYKIKYS